MVDAGIIVIVAAISPFASERNFARSLFSNNEFYEIFINTPMVLCKNRDIKGLYKKSNKDKNMSKIGLGLGYEIPKNPDLVVSTEQMSVEEIAEKIMRKFFSLL